MYESLSSFTYECLIDGATHHPMAAQRHRPTNDLYDHDNFIFCQLEQRLIHMIDQGLDFVVEKANGQITF